MTRTFHKSKLSYKKVFLIGFILSSIMLLPYVIYGKGILLLSNDFNTQQMPFYVMANKSIRNGEFFFSWLTDLGTSFIGSYMFYMLGSPFFAISLLFPPAAVPYLMAPLLALKFGVATLTSYAFLQRYVKNKEYALIGALLYAFSGFQIFNMFYNHFHDAVAFFPLLLIALDERMDGKKRGTLALAIALNFITNYIFFVGEAIFLAIYFVVKLISKDYKLTLRKFISLAIEVILGIGISAFVFVAVLFVAENPRNSAKLSGWDAFTYNPPLKYIEIIRAFLFPADIPHVAPFYEKTAVTRWQSTQAYLPMFSIAGALAFLKTRKNNFISRMLIICGVIAFVPLLNSVFYFFNSFYYSRWYYMMILMIALATVICLDNEEEFRSPLKNSVIFVICAAAIFALVSAFFPNYDEDGVFRYGLFTVGDFIFLIVFAIIAIVSSAYLLSILKLGDTNLFRKKLFISIVVSILVCGNITLISTHYVADESPTYKENLIDAGSAFDDYKTDENFRIDTSSLYYNVHMWWGLPSMATFNSNINGNEMQFYEIIGAPRFVATMPSDSLYGLRALFSVKYIFYQGDRLTTMWGTEYKETRMDYDIYENQNYIPMGFTYDYHIRKQTLDLVPDWKKHISLVQAILLDDEQIAKYGDILPDITTLEASPLLIDYDIFKDEVVNRRAKSAHFFERKNDGFRAKIDLDTPNLVFFSVPYDEGFTATVNGERAEIELVNGGFMAVYCDAGQDIEIEFSYMPRGFKSGMAISIISLIATIAYIFAPKFVRKRNVKGEC